MRKVDVDLLPERYCDKRNYSPGPPGSIGAKYYIYQIVYSSYAPVAYLALFAYLSLTRAFRCVRVRVCECLSHVSLQVFTGESKT